MNIFIAGLSNNITDADLLELFAEYGEINSAKVIIDRDTQRSKGFGFVEVNDDALAKKAIEELNGAEYDGKQIFLSEARPKTDSPRQGNDRGFNRNRNTGGGGYNR